MANRNYNRVQALAKETKLIYAQVTIGASGAPTLVQPLGVASIVRNSAGLYTITLQDAYMALQYAHVEVVTPTAEDIQANVVAEDVSGAKTVQFRTTAVGVATDPADGDSLLIKLELRNSSVVY